jgi:hypothetical protein
MDKEFYTEQLFEISKGLSLKLFNLQNRLTKEEIIEYTPIFNFFFVELFERVVGKEDLISYMIELLKMADNLANDREEQNKRQIKRFEELSIKQDED